MVIHRKSSKHKRYYEAKGQDSFFGYDNLHFKTVNLPARQNFKNLCPKFNLKKIVQTKSIFIKKIEII